MPRFNAEQIPNALKEQMLRRLLDKELLDKRPMVGWDVNTDEFSQEFSPRPQGEMQYGSINEPVVNQRMQQGRGFDDTKSAQQANRDRRMREEAYLYSKTPMTNPLHYNNPPAFRHEFGAATPAGTPLQRLYQDVMPQQLPRYPMMVMPPTDDSPEMEQLQSFYSGEDI